jgi:Zn-dependent peptidase ImmA (M78 family)/transcriptional regulator with XRE-family HTH domain
LKRHRRIQSVEKLGTNVERPEPGTSTGVFWGERLQLAREFKGWTQKELGQCLGVSHALISDYENGKRIPAGVVLGELAGITGFLPEFFLSRVKDPFAENECSFRHRRTTPERVKTRVKAHATLLGIVVSSLRAIFRFPALDVPSIPARTTEEIEAAAQACRAHWGLDLNAPILQVGRVLERAGVVIISGAVDTAKVDAFSRRGQNSLVFLNRGVGSPPSRWNFDLAHECGHLVMHDDLPTGSVETESAADRFASAFLLPRAAFSREFRVRKFTWQHVFELKQRWQVSAAAIIRRAYDLSLLDELTYQQAFKHISFKKWRVYGEPFEPLFQEPELFVNALNALGLDTRKTLNEIANEAHFTPETFAEVTGVPLPASAAPLGRVIKFRST